MPGGADEREQNTCESNSCEEASGPPRRAGHRNLPAHADLHPRNNAMQAHHHHAPPDSTMSFSRQDADYYAEDTSSSDDADDRPVYHQLVTTISTKQQHRSAVESSVKSTTPQYQQPQSPHPAPSSSDTDPTTSRTSGDSSSSLTSTSAVSSSGSECQSTAPDALLYVHLNACRASSSGSASPRRRVSWHAGRGDDGRPVSADLHFFRDDEVWRCNIHHIGPAILPAPTPATLPHRVPPADPALQYELNANLPDSNAQLVHRLINQNVQLESILVRRGTGILLFDSLLL